MKKAIYAFGCLIAALTLTLSGCKKDDPEVLKLVVVKRSSGVLYTVDKTSGALTEIMTLMYNNVPLTNLRGLVYDKATGKCFASATNTGDGILYSIDISTGVATILNDNADYNWDAIADLVIAPDGNILSVIYSNLESQSALLVFNKTTGVEGTHMPLLDAEDAEVWSPGGITYGSDNSHLIIGGENEIYFSNMSGAISSSKVLQQTANMNPDGDMRVMDLEKDTDGAIYAMVYEDSDNVEYIVKVNTETGVLTEITDIATGNASALYHCMALIPESKLK